MHYGSPFRIPFMLALETPRHLVRFDAKRVPHMFTDVLILGAGIAGIRAALAVDPSLETVVISKDRLAESNSSYAQGGIAGVLDPEDDFAHHAADTVAAGKGLCDPAIVDLVVREAPDRIAELVRYGADFDRVAATRQRAGRTGPDPRGRALPTAASCTPWATRPAGR